MDHPGIARIYDGGTTESGRPYFVMEYVPGQPITDFCDDAGIDVPARLQLFVRVCEAVQHAHGKGIVHRDLKPSNVLVVERDGEPVAKVIDFGIAYATDGMGSAGGSGDERATRASEIIGTYAYMSPEQADPACESVDGRADVYALGVMLFELLTGVLPVEVDDLRGKSPSEVWRMLADNDPPAPSTKLGRMGSASSHVAGCRGGLDARTLRKRLTGDLDWITLRAMERDPNRRYPSAAALAKDVRRHLADQPVVAGPPSAAYRVAKFVRRRRVGVAAAAVIGLTLASGATGTILGFSEASGEARIARAAESEARLQADTARRALALEAERRQSLESYNDTLLDLVDLSNPEAPLRSDESAVSLLHDLRKTVSEIFADDPLAEAEVRVRVGRALRMRGELEHARDDLLRAQSLQREVGAPAEDRLEAIRELHNLAIDTGGYADYAAGLSAAALEVQLLADLDGNVGDAADDLFKSASVHDVDRVASALASLQASLQASAVVSDLAVQALAADLVGLTGGYLGLHLAFREAEPLLSAALAMQEKNHGATHPEVVCALDELVLHLHQQGRSHVAAQILGARVDAFRERFAPGHWLRAEVDSLLGECLSLQGMEESGLALLTSSHAAILKDRGPHSRVAIHAALRLREHYVRHDRMLVPQELDDALASPLALSRDPGGAWMRTAESLGAGEDVTQAISELFSAIDPTAAIGPRSARAANVLSSLVATTGSDTRDLGDLLARALVAVEPRMRGGDHALAQTWSEAIERAESRADWIEQRDAERSARVAELQASSFRRDEHYVDLRGPAPELSEPVMPVADPPQPSAPEAEIPAVEAQVAVEPPDAPDPFQPTSDELILFAWYVSASPSSATEHYALALDACEMAMELEPGKADFGVVKSLALARVGAAQAALTELSAIEKSLGDVGMIGWAARALAHDVLGNKRKARYSLYCAEIDAVFYPGTLPPGTVQLLFELERRLRD
jgi:hypothetical protein